MEQKTVIVNVYPFDELSRRVQQNLVAALRTDELYHVVLEHNFGVMGRAYLESEGFIVDTIGPTFFTTPVMSGDWLLPLLDKAELMPCDRECLIDAPLSKITVKVSRHTNLGLHPTGVEVDFLDQKSSGPRTQLRAFEKAVNYRVFHALSVLGIEYSRAYQKHYSARTLRKELRAKGCIYLKDGSIFQEGK